MDLTLLREMLMYSQARNQDRILLAMKSAWGSLPRLSSCNTYAVLLLLPPPGHARFVASEAHISETKTRYLISQCGSPDPQHLYG